MDRQTERHTDKMITIEAPPISSGGALMISQTDQHLVSLSPKKYVFKTKLPSISPLEQPLPSVSMNLHTRLSEPELCEKYMKIFNL